MLSGVWESSTFGGFQRTLLMPSAGIFLGLFRTKGILDCLIWSFRHGLTGLS